jgi:hypothetical protein
VPFCLLRDVCALLISIPPSPGPCTPESSRQPYNGATAPALLIPVPRYFHPHSGVLSEATLPDIRWVWATPLVLSSFVAEVPVFQKTRQRANPMRGEKRELKRRKKKIMRGFLTPACNNPPRNYDVLHPAEQRSRSGDAGCLESPKHSPSLSVSALLRNCKKKISSGQMSRSVR